MPTKKEIREGLKEVRKLIEDPKHWTQRAAARDKYGHEVEPEHPSAAKFCVFGACKRVSSEYGNLVVPLNQTLRKEGPYYKREPRTVIRVNDHWGTRKECHTKILEIIDETIKRLEV